MKHKICYGKTTRIWQSHYDKVEQLDYWDTLYNPHAYHGIKRIRMTCELCGRRVLSSIWNNEDGDIIHVLPPHKPKHWWKKKKAKW
jgi:hypothetical protein